MLFDCFPFSPDVQNSLAEKILASQGNSYLVKDMGEAKKIYFKDAQLFFKYDQENLLHQVMIPIETTNKVKKNRHAKQIDSETEKEIAKGFVFDRHRFSLSQSAQINWQGMLLLHQSDLFENQEISTKDDGNYLLVTSKLIDFIKAASVVIKNTLKTGRDKKKQL